MLFMKHWDGKNMTEFSMVMHCDLTSHASTPENAFALNSPCLLHAGHLQPSRTSHANDPYFRVQQTRSKMGVEEEEMRSSLWVEEEEMRFLLAAIQALPNSVHYIAVPAMCVSTM